MFDSIELGVRNVRPTLEGDENVREEAKKKKSSRHQNLLTNKWILSAFESMGCAAPATPPIGAAPIIKTNFLGEWEIRKISNLNNLFNRIRIPNSVKFLLHFMHRSALDCYIDNNFMNE